MDGTATLSFPDGRKLAPERNLQLCHLPRNILIRPRLMSQPRLWSTVTEPGVRTTKVSSSANAGSAMGTEADLMPGTGPPRRSNSPCILNVIAISSSPLSHAAGGQ